LNLTAGTSTSSLTIPITVPSSLFSKRIRGLDVVLTFTATSAPADLLLTNLKITIPYKNNTWTVFDRIRANLDTTPASAYIQGGTNTTTCRVSPRFFISYSYITGSGENYSEAGLSPAVSTSYNIVGSNYCLKGIDASATIPALSKQGCYYAGSVGPAGTTITSTTWSFASINGAVLPFNEPTINVVITDASNATSYAGYTLTVKLEVEVDAGDVPYVIFGPNRSGVYNELEGQGPSYVADIGAVGFDTNKPNVDILSCPCEIDSTLQDRQYPKSFPADSRFICGTKKYGPSGNRELQAAYATQTYYYQNQTSRPPLLGGSQITANFFSIFDTIPHRASPNLINVVNTQSPVLQVLPSAAFISSSVTRDLGSVTVPFELNLPKLYMGLRIQFNSSVVQPVNAVLAVNNPRMYNNYQGAISAAGSVTVATTGFILNIGMQSGNC
jgi:hypothetical protein